MKTILLTGAAGFIASEVAVQLLDRKYRVIGIDNFNDYYDVNLKENRIKNISNSNFILERGDIEDKQFIQNIFKKYKIDSVYNLAARAGVRYSMENPDIYFTTNVIGLLNILTAMKDNGVMKITLASTSSLYAGLELPFNESSAVNTPISPYAASKKAAETLCYTYHHLYRFDVSIVRYFTVYGPSGRPDMSILRFIHWIYQGTPIKLFGDGKQSRDFTYVTDIAKGTILAHEQFRGYEIYNLGGGNRPTNMLEIIQLIEKLIGKKAIINHLPFHQADMADTQADITKARTILKWEPLVGIEDGIKHSINWYLNNKDLLKNLDQIKN